MTSDIKITHQNADYSMVNNAANALFFSGAYSNEPIYLDLEDDALDVLAAELSINTAEAEEVICKSVAATLIWGNSNLYSWHLKNLKAWRASGTVDAPPFTALLLVLSLAAERMRADEEYSANNYYRRLAELLDVYDDTKFELLRSNGKNTEIYWKSLNLWLQRLDNDLGVPTAAPAHKTWKYVGYALSQSLVRDADRTQMHRMFTNFRLGAGETISPMEMALYLEEWLGHQHSPAWLRRLWANPDLRDKIAQIASEELEVWEGAPQQGEVSGLVQGSRITWLATKKTFPKLKLKLYPSLNQSVFSDEDDLTLKIAGSELPAGVQNLLGSDENYLTPPEGVSLQALLGQHFEVVGSKSDATVHGKARPVMLLCKVDEGNHYLEVSRVRSNRKHIILTHEGWTDRVERHLQSYSGAGYLQFDGANHEFVPQGWTCFVDVVFDLVPDGAEVEQNLEMLVPFDEIATIQALGGMKLGHGLWHKSSPPLINLPPSVPDNQKVEVCLEQYQGEHKSTLHASRRDEFPDNIWSHIEADLSGAQLTISAGSKARSLSLGLRSADQARRFSAHQRKRLFWNLANPASLITATEESEHHSMEGVISPLTLAAPPETSARLQVSSDIADTAQLPVQIEEGYEIELNGGAHQPAPCILQGYHYWICEAYEGPATQNSRLVICRDCSARLVLPDPRRLRGRRQAPATGSRKLQAKGASNLSLVSEVSASMETAVDAICYRGEGSWETLRSTLSAVTEEPAELGQLARQMCNAGLIDMKRQLGTGSIDAWVVPPPALVFDEVARSLLLVGFRSEQLLFRLSDALEGLGRKESEAEHQLFSMHRWVDLTCDYGELQRVLAPLRDVYDRPVTLCSDVAQKILTNCSDLSSVVNLLPMFHVDESVEREKFDLSRGRWELCPQNEAVSAGAYRVRSRGNTYLFVDATGCVRHCSYEIAKLLAAAQEGMAMHRYDPQTNSLMCVVGADCTPLISRALVMHSGRLPTLQDGLWVYSEMAPELGQLALNRLYS